MSHPTITSSHFFEKMLLNSDTYIFHLLPIFKNQEIIDFTLNYATENTSKLTSIKHADYVHKKCSKIAPIIFNNGLFEILKACLNKPDLEIDFERSVTIAQIEHWFMCKALAYDNGVTVRLRDITQLKKTEQKQIQLNKELQLQNTLFHDSEVIAKMASFRWNISLNEWYFSDNMWNLFSKKIHHPNIPKNGIFECIDAKFSPNLKEEIEALMYEETFPLFNFSNGKSSNKKFYALTGHFIPVQEGQMMLGVIRDITDEVKIERNLKRKNKELLKANSELDSFNYIASHDLQEPLRKIKMFISRIEESENTPKEKRKNYFNKIQDSASRMEALIQNLLTYSRIGKSIPKSEKISLNEIIDEVVLEFSEKSSISTSISAAQLPEIAGVTFMIKQLFYNLIGNAIKYQKKDTPLEIKIEGKIRSKNTLQNIYPFSLRSENYLELCIIDNGIGFKQEYQHKVFQLFQRLHEKEKYSGTGVGLAICKKIVEAHKGFITVRSMEQVGSEFIILFPVKNTPNNQI